MRCRKCKNYNDLNNFCMAKVLHCDAELWAMCPDYEEEKDLRDEEYHSAKFDQGKKRYDLIPEICVREIMRGEDSKYVWAQMFSAMATDHFDSIDGVLEILLFGLTKYKEDSWKTVPNAQNRYHAAYLRHLDERSEGEKCASDSKLPHLHHALCNVMFLLWFEIKEDKPHLFEKEKPEVKLGTSISWEAKDRIAKELEVLREDNRILRQELQRKS